MRQKACALVLVFMLTVSGCASQSGQNRTEGASIGAGIGAVLGAIAGIAFGGSGEAAGIGAAIGAAFGGVVGYSYAEVIDDKKKDLSGKENDLDARINYAISVNNETKEQSSKLKNEVASLGTEIDELVTEIANGNTTSTKLSMEKQKLLTQIEHADSTLETATKELNELKEFNVQKNSPELDAQIAMLEETVSDLQNTTSTLAAINLKI